MRQNAKLQELLVTGVFLLFSLSLLAPPALSDPPPWPPEKPLPRLETGMHIAPIWRLSLDAQERFLVTASKDKTARVWDLTGNDLKLLQVLRVPVGADPYEGQLFAVAISPDGAEVAAAGYTGKKALNAFSIYIFDRASGQLKQALGGLPAEISHLTFSPDGRYLAAIMVGKGGLRVFAPGASGWSEVFRDSRYGWDSYWVDFDPQNRLVTTSFDGFLRLYEPVEGKFSRTRKVEVKGAKKPVTARFSPDGSLLAVGFLDAPRVQVYSGQTLEPLPPPHCRGLKNGHLARVAWSRNGEFLYAGGGVAEAGVHPVLRWSQAGRGALTRLPASHDSIMDLIPLTDGRLVFGAADPAWGILAPSGPRLAAHLPNTPDFRNNQKEFRISPDGRVVEFGFALQNPDLSQTHHRARLDIKTRQFTLDPPADSVSKGLRPPDSAGFKDSDWKDTNTPTFRGRKLAFYDPLAKSRCLARIPQHRGFILGTDWELLFFGPQAEPLFSQGKNYEYEGQVIRLSSTACCINVSGNGDVVVAALGDGSLRWYDLREDGKEILAFVRHRDGRWVMWSPEGFFTCSSDGGQLIGYHINQGPDRTPRFVTSDQLYDQFYRHDLVSWRLDGRLAQEVETALRQGDARQVLAQGLPPAVELPGPTEVHQTGKEFPVEVKITDQGGGVGKLVYRIDDVALETRSIPGVVIPGRRERTMTAHLLLKPGKNVITVTAYNSRGLVESAPVSRTVYIDEAADHPSLYGLVVGVASYQETPLKYPADDAQALKSELEKRSRGLFKEVKIKPLGNQEATRQSIEAAFRDLAPQVKPNDVFLLFLAGHGLNVDGRYCFVPYSLQSTDPESQAQARLDQEKLQALLAGIPAQKSLILIDTCFAGAFTDLAAQSDAQQTGLNRLHRATGRAIISAAGIKQVALEGEGHGVFTHALLRGLQGDADRIYGNDDGEIDVQELGSTIKALVPQISRKMGAEQTPLTSDLRGLSFAIARVGD